MTKDVIAAILERRCIRSFKDDPVPRATVGRLIDAARWAPTAGNLQPWQFYVVYDDKKKREIAQAAYNQRFVGYAPVVIIVCTQPEISAAKYGERGTNLYAIQDSAAAAQNIMLAACGYGLGTCWVGAFNENMLIEALNLPPGVLPVVIIPVGYPDEENKAPARRPVEEIVHIIE